jgi:hypothetical protein
MHRQHVGNAARDMSGFACNMILRIYINMQQAGASDDPFLTPRHRRREESPDLG